MLLIILRLPQMLLDLSITVQKVVLITAVNAMLSQRSSLSNCYMCSRIPCTVVINTPLLIGRLVDPKRRIKQNIRRFGDEILQYCASREIYNQLQRRLTRTQFAPIERHKLIELV